MKQPTNKTAPLRWAAAALGAAVLGVVWAYVWRVLYHLDTRISPLVTTLGCVGFALAAEGACALLRYAVKGFAARGAVCVALCGLLFVFANPPLQTPDETEHYLRTYAISMGRLDFDGARGYPEDVDYLMEAFPGAWVNAHTSVGVGTDPITGADKPYDTAGYALKQYEDGLVQSIADSFARYLARDARDSYAPEVHEPISFLILPFLPGALGLAVARLLGLGALGCLYAGRIGNLLAYTALCYATLRAAQRARPVFLALVLLPVSLYMGASLSYDATLLGCYYLMLALLTRDRWTTRTAAVYAVACVWVNVAKPYLNLLWALLPLLVAAGEWRAKGRRWQWSLGCGAGALAATLFVEWYGSAMRANYSFGRQGGAAVNGMEQLRFVLANPLRTIAVFWGTLYESDFFLGQTGVFGWKDLPVAFLNLTGPLVLVLAALLAAAEPQPLGRRRGVGLGVFAAVYALGAMAAMYITYTPVGMVRIVGLQTRYFLPVFLVLALGIAALARKTLAPGLAAARAEALALPLCGGYAALGAVLVFQHYFVGPVYAIPAMMPVP